MSTLNLVTMLLRLLLSKITGNLISKFYGDIFGIWFDPLVAVNTVEWSWANPLPPHWLIFHTLSQSRGCSAPGFCLDPLLCRVSLGILLSPNIVYMLMIPKSIFSAPTNPRISGFIYLTACWTFLLEYIIDT